MYNKLLEEIDKGISGDIRGIPLEDLPRLSFVLNNIQKSMYYLIAGSQGSGKTSFLDDIFILRVYDWYLNNKDKSPVKINWIYRSMERNVTYKLAKWTCIRLYQKYQIKITVAELLGWKKRIGIKDILPKVKECEVYFQELFDNMILISGSENPTGIFKHIIEYYSKIGKIEKVDEYHKKYIPNNEDLITIITSDHFGKLKLERGYDKKRTIDKMSEYFSICRDFYGSTIVALQQYNRDLSNITRFKEKELTPQLEDLKDSSVPSDDADLVLALFDPYRHKIYDHMGYDIKKLIVNGYNRFRSISVLKNSYGIDDVRIAYRFIGELGIFNELPKVEKFKENINLYNKVLEW